MNIFFDFDGTLIDSTVRQYELFCSLVPECKLTYEEYWRIKRTKVTQETVLVNFFSYSKEQCEYVKEKWIESIEKQVNLEKDNPFLGAGNMLRRLSEDANLYLVTARQSTPMVEFQVKKFGWSNIFTQLLVTNQTSSKYDLINEKISYSDNDIFIGDTGEDIITGKKLGVRTIAVSYGILNKNVLKEYHPDYIVDDICELNSYINQMYMND